MAADRDDIAAELVREFDQIASKRGIWEKHWEETALKVLPYYSTSFYSQGNTVPGQKRNQEQYDVTANAALWKFAAAMESMLTPANGKWHRLRPVQKELMKIRRVALWFDQVNDALFHYRYSPHSAFQANQHDGYVSIGAFGTTALFCDEFNDPTQPGVKGLRYRHVHLGELFFATNFQGQVDKVFRRFKMTLRQIAQKWGEDKLPENLRGQLSQSPENEVFVLHIVKPNGEFDPMRLDAKGKRFSSHYVLKDMKKLLHAGGYRCFPYATSRYITAPGELYGRSPAMNVLPSIQVLNEEKKVILKQGHRAVDPVLLAHDDGILDGFSLKPGATNYGAVNGDGRPLVHTLPTGNMQIGKELMDDERAVINDAFLVTLFQILVETPQMTATEVLERAREKGALLSPTMGRFQSESIGPMIQREFDILMWQGLIPPPPPEVMEAGAAYKVEYDAPLNRAMRADEASGIMRTAQYAAEIVGQTQDPSAMDWFDWDTIIPELADISGAPFRFMRSPEAVAQIRQGRQSQQTTQEVTNALPGMAAMMKSAAPQGTAQTPGQPGAQ
ncbi:bacteriophage head to tail connecting protein [Burkholderia lata]|uniref:Bacteriophage head to tail connecting protein n=1 Tax=Burkholderia lata (strain ATCC 17760 / DSM 23089 / LMG 22485 / NCIMB 9086 / R18194 / 383) TaxID=482957 RepID=A0A6P2W566_BURL3|nr:portal protein [Burkholderia lata]VWC95895.1 bacteriophage head to tail connecting protein [Burkholderia lata]